MPIDESTWEEATEQDSTASQITEFLQANGSEAYTTNELVAEIVPEETDDESVVAYYRAVLELLARNGSVEKRNVSVDSDEADTIPYFRAADESEAPAERTPVTEQTQPTTREVPLDRPIRVRMAEDSGTIPVRIEGERRPEANSDDVPFFVRWYRWYRGRKRRATLKNDPSK